MFHAKMSSGLLCHFLVFMLVVGAPVQQTVQLQGVVTMSDGSLVPNASVKATNRSTGQVFSGSTDNEGHYQITVTPGIYDLVFEIKNFAPKRLLNVSVSPNQSQSVDIIFDDTQPILTGPLIVHGTLKGTVKDAKGKPIKKAEVIIKDLSGKSQAPVHTDSKGRFEKNLIVGTYSVRARADGFLDSSETSSTIRKNKSTTQHFKLSPR